jgi:hypothetical protein
VRAREDAEKRVVVGFVFLRGKIGGQDLEILESALAVQAWNWSCEISLDSCANLYKRAHRVLRNIHTLPAPPWIIRRGIIEENWEGRLYSILA